MHRHRFLDWDRNRHGSRVGVGYILLVREHDHGRFLGVEESSGLGGHVLLLHESILQILHAFYAGGEGTFVGERIGRGGRKRSIVIGIVDDSVLIIVNVLNRFGRPGWRLHIGGNSRDRKAWASKNSLAELGERDSLVGVLGEDPSQDIVKLIREGKDSLQKVRVPGKSAVCGILNRSLLPGVAATS